MLIARSTFRNYLSTVSKSAILLGIAGLLLSAVTSCSNYQLGTGTKVKFSTLFIAPVTAKTVIPQAKVVITTQLREAFIKDGRVTLVDSPELADAILRITLIGYDRTVAVSRPDDTGLARRFDLTLKATASLTDNRTKETYFTDRPLSAKRGVFTDSGLVPAEYDTVPLLAEQLANETVHAVLDVW
ncbi:MAG: LPS assembly lipoprotein LptE [Lacunisphaera sp.]